MTKFVFQYYDDSGTIPDMSFELNGEHKYIAFTLDKADATVAGEDWFRATGKTDSPDAIAIGLICSKFAQGGIISETVK